MLTEEEEITKFYRIRRTLMQMLKDRGYLVTDDEINMTENQFVDTYGEKIRREHLKDLTIFKAMVNDSSDQIYVFFVNQGKEKAKLGKDEVEAYTDHLESENVKRCILVVQKKLHFKAKQLIVGMAPKIRVEVFQEGELIVNVTRNVLVPKHQLLTDEEKKALLKKYSVKETQLPRIQVNDPIARYYGFVCGQVVRIIRPSETVGTSYVTYRYVV